MVSICSICIRDYSIESFYYQQAALVKMHVQMYVYRAEIDGSNHDALMVTHTHKPTHEYRARRGRKLHADL